MKKIISYLNGTVKKEKNKLVFVVIIFIIGIILGSLFINFITNDDKKLLIEQLNVYFENIKKLSSDVFGIKVFTSEIINNGIQLFFIFALGISMIGIPFVIFILFFKGFMLGTTISTMFLKYQLKGVIAAFLYVFPFLIINVLIYILTSFYAVHASVKFLKALFKKESLNFKSFLGKYLLTFIISIILMIISCLFESFLMPLLLKLFTFLT